MATQIKTIINNFLKKKEEDVLLKSRIKKVVYNILDDKIRSYVSFGSIYKNKLILYASSSAAGYKIKLLKNKILEELISQGYKIKNVLVKIKNGKE